MHTYSNDKQIPTFETIKSNMLLLSLNKREMTVLMNFKKVVR